MGRSGDRFVRGTQAALIGVLFLDVLPARRRPDVRSSRFQPRWRDADALQRSRQGPRARPGTLPQAHQRAPRQQDVPQMRKRAPPSRTQPVPFLRGEAAQGRARPVRQGQGRRQALRRPGSQGPPKDRAGEKQEAPPGTSGRRPVHALRPPFLRSRAARPAGLAVTRGKRPNGSSMPSGGPQGRCGRCGGPALDRASRCGPCAALEAGRHPRKNAASRRRYAHRRERWRCTDCGELHRRERRGACRARTGPGCARAEHRGLPILPPRYTVIETATGEDHGTWDSWEEVAMCLAFARLSHEQVEIISRYVTDGVFYGGQ